MQIFCYMKCQAFLKKKKESSAAFVNGILGLIFKVYDIFISKYMMYNYTHLYWVSWILDQEITLDTSIGLDKNGHQVNIFLISPCKHML